MAQICYSPASVFPSTVIMFAPLHPHLVLLFYINSDNTHTCNRYFYSVYCFLYLFLLFNIKNLKFNTKLHSVSVGVMNNISRYWHRLLVLYSGYFCLLAALGNIWRQLRCSTLRRHAPQDSAHYKHHCTKSTGQATHQDKYRHRRDISALSDVWSIYWLGVERTILFLNQTLVSFGWEHQICLEF